MSIIDREEWLLIKDGLTLTKRHAYLSMMRLEKSVEAIKKAKPEEANTIQIKHERSITKYTKIARVYDKVNNLRTNLKEGGT